MKYTVRDADGNVTRFVEWDGETTWSPPDGHRVELYRSGDHVPVPEQRGPTLREEYAAATDKVACIARQLGLTE